MDTQIAMNMTRARSIFRQTFSDRVDEPVHDVDGNVVGKRRVRRWRSHPSFRTWARGLKIEAKTTGKLADIRATH